MGFKSPAVDTVGIIENYMKVAMLLVDMASHEILIFTFEKLLAYLLTNLQCSLRRYLPRLETHNEVLGKYGAFARTEFSDLLKVKMSLFGFGTAPFGENQSAVISLFGISDIFQRCKLIN